MQTTNNKFMFCARVTLNSRLHSNLLTFLAFLSGFSIPVSTALENLATTLLILVALSLNPVRNQIVATLKNWFVLSCVILYALFFCGAIWSHAPVLDIMHTLSKMRFYLFVPIFVAIFLHPQSRIGAVIGFLVGNLINLLLSWITWLVDYPILQGASNSGSWTIFRSHTYHAIFILLIATAILAVILSNKISRKNIFLAWAIIILSVLNVLFVTDSRTGAIMLFIMFAMVFLQWKLKQGIVVTLVMTLFIPIIFSISPNIKYRMLQAKHNISQFNEGSLVDTPVGVRMEFHRVSSKLIQQSPFIGHGTGSFAKSYQEYVESTDGPMDTSGKRLLSGNPHNDYMWIGVQLGGLGILALIGVIISFAYCALKFPVPERWISLVLIGSFVIISWENSFFSDNISSLCFVLLSSALISGKIFDAD